MAFLEIERHKVVGCAQLYEEIGKIHTQYGQRMGVDAGKMQKQAGLFVAAVRRV
jgi:hypothetical protein